MERRSVMGDATTAYCRQRGASLASFAAEAVELAHLTVSSLDRYVPRAAGVSLWPAPSD